MAEKRYQVFVSSTYKDLEEERWEAAKVLLSHDCFVSGMEYFPSTGDEQFEYIKEVITGCDYYILILGGRYGSIAPDGISYTEKEYDYALGKGLKPISFVYYDPQNLPPEKRESDPEAYRKFCSFREKVRSKLGSEWRDINELKVKISESISAAIRRSPGIGWVRGNTIANEDVLQENYKLRKKIEQLENQLRDCGISDFDEKILDKLLLFKVQQKNGDGASFDSKIKYRILMENMFASMQQSLRRCDVEKSIRKCILDAEIVDKNCTILYIKRGAIEFFMKQMQLYEVINLGYAGNIEIYTLTPLGKKLAKQMLLTPRTISG